MTLLKILLSHTVHNALNPLPPIPVPVAASSGAHTASVQVQGRTPAEPAPLRREPRPVHAAHPPAHGSVRLMVCDLRSGDPWCSRVLRQRQGGEADHLAHTHSAPGPQCLHHMTGSARKVQAAVAGVNSLDVLRPARSSDVTTHLAGIHNRPVPSTSAQVPIQCISQLTGGGLPAMCSCLVQSSVAGDRHARCAEPALHTKDIRNNSTRLKGAAGRYLQNAITWSVSLIIPDWHGSWQGALHSMMRPARVFLHFESTKTLGCSRATVLTWDFRSDSLGGDNLAV